MGKFPAAGIASRIGADGRPLGPTGGTVLAVNCRKGSFSADGERRRLENRKFA